MRGSPLLRTFLVLLAMVGSGFGFLRLTAKEPRVVLDPSGEETAGATENSFINARCFLEVSGAVESLSLTSDPGEATLVRDVSDSFTGEVLIDPDTPVLFLKITWDGPSTGHRFAKLTIEAPGRETFTHVFDSPGDIDDFVELPF